jgi:hypothetical protein
LHLHDLRSSVWRDAPDREWQISLIETDALQLTMPNQIDVAHHVAHRQWARERATVIDAEPVFDTPVLPQESRLKIGAGTHREKEFHGTHRPDCLRRALFARARRHQCRTDGAIYGTG